MVKVLVIGQTPPPYGGQALMIESLVNAQFHKVQIYHVRMAFSDSFVSIGKVQWKKALHLIRVMVKALRLKFRHEIDIVYYPPAGPNLIPVLRDIVLLTILRRFFKKTVFHFHAAGLSEFVETRPKVLRRIAVRAYRNPNASIQTSGRNPHDGEYFHSRMVAIIPNGLRDEGCSRDCAARSQKSYVEILYAGILTEAKGIMVLLDAARILQDQNLSFRICFMGQFSSCALETRVRDFCSKHGLSDSIAFIGVKLNEEKWKYFSQADIFCFPTYFESESFPNVVVEAMMFQLPVVATDWRGIPDLVSEGITGYLVPVKDPVALAERLSSLMNNPDLRTRLGRNGREQFLRNNAIEQHLNAMEDVFCQIGSQS